MSDTPNTYEYIVKKQAMLNVDSLNERIAELESANAFLKEQNDNLTALSRLVSNVKQEQKVADFCNFIDRHLLDNDLEIEVCDSDADGVRFLIPDSRVVDGKIVRNLTNYTVSGSITYTWTVELDAWSEDDAQEIAESFISETSASFHSSHEPDGLTSFDIDDYNPYVDVSETYEN